MNPATPDSTAQFHYLPPERCSEDALIQMQDIYKSFKTAEGDFAALKGVTTCFYPGEFVSIVGKSGSGKSTLVNMLTGIDHPTSGSVRVGDSMIHTMSENKMSRWRGRNLGIVFQFFQLMPTLTLLENVMLPMALCGSCNQPSIREQRARELLALVGLEALADKQPAAVSGGQQQSAAIARALANDPPILIADEPTGNLDSRSADIVFDVFSGLVEQGKTILMVTHDASLAQRTQRILLLSDGELIKPWVAQAFDDLSHSQMLWLTHHLEAHTLEAGAPAVSPNSLIAGLCLVTSGRLEVRRRGDQYGSPLLSLAPGEYLSGFDLQAIGADGISLQAGSREATSLLILEAESFQSWVSGDPTARANLEAAVHDRRIRLGQESG